MYKAILAQAIWYSAGKSGASRAADQSMVWTFHEDGFSIVRRAIAHATAHLECCLDHETGQQQLMRCFDIGFIIPKAKHRAAFRFFQDNDNSSLLLYRTLQPEYKQVLIC